MAFICPVCDQSVGHFKCSQIKDGVVCNACFEKSGLKKAGFPAKTVEVWEVVTACDMTEEEKLAHIEKKREQLQQENEIARKRMAEISTRVPEPAVPTCKKCGSTSISANKKGFSAGKAVAGVVVTSLTVGGLVGLTAGGIGAKKIRITCLNCGHQWDAGK